MRTIVQSYQLLIVSRKWGLSGWYSLWGCNLLHDLTKERRWHYSLLSGQRSCTCCVFRVGVNGCGGVGNASAIRLLALNHKTLLPASMQFITLCIRHKEHRVNGTSTLALRAVIHTRSVFWRVRSTAAKHLSPHLANSASRPAVDSSALSSLPSLYVTDKCVDIRLDDSNKSYLKVNPQSGFRRFTEHSVGYLRKPSHFV